MMSVGWTTPTIHVIGFVVENHIIAGDSPNVTEDFVSALAVVAIHDHGIHGAAIRIKHAVGGDFASTPLDIDHPVGYTGPGDYRYDALRQALEDAYRQAIVERLEAYGYQGGFVQTQGWVPSNRLYPIKPTRAIVI